MTGLSAAQGRMARVVRMMDRGVSCPIPVAPSQRDAFGRQLDLDPRKYKHLFSIDGRQVSRRVREFLVKLQREPVLRAEVNAAIMNYDVRMYDAPEEFWVAAALAYAKNLIDTTGRETGHTIHLGKDAYDRHGRVLDIFAYTLLRTRIFNNGGGIICWGTVDGGTMKAAGMIEKATTGENGNWGYATVSHKGGEPNLKGMKFGVSGKVVCVEELVDMLFKPLLAVDTEAKDVLIPLRDSRHPEKHVTYVGNLTEFQAHLAHRMIGARTTMDPAEVAIESTLVGMNVAVPTDGSPLVGTLANVAENLGANVFRLKKDGPNEPGVIRDPNESASYGVRSLMEGLQWLRGTAEGTVTLYLDPDGDRGGLIATDLGTGRSVNIAGTDLFFLATHNLATCNPSDSGIVPSTVADMRAFIAALELGKALKTRNHLIEVSAAEPGYNQFHGMIAQLDAVLGIEETSHTMIRPYSHALWGAPKHLAGVQGGDNAGLFLIYMLGLQKYMWEGRNPVEQLAYIRKTFCVPLTSRFEHKPMLAKEMGMAKLAIAQGIQAVAGELFGGHPTFNVIPIDTGVALHCLPLSFAVMARHSKSGSGFTESVEVVDPNTSQLAIDLGHALILLGAERGKASLNDPAHEFHALAGFELLPKDDATRRLMQRRIVPMDVVRRALAMAGAAV